MDSWDWDFGDPNQRATIYEQEKLVRHCILQRINVTANLPSQQRTKQRANGRAKTQADVLATELSLLHADKTKKKALKDEHSRLDEQLGELEVRQREITPQLTDSSAESQKQIRRCDLLHQHGLDLQETLATLQSSQTHDVIDTSFYNSLALHLTNDEGGLLVEFGQLAGNGWGRVELVRTADEGSYEVRGCQPALPSLTSHRHLAIIGADELLRFLITARDAFDQHFADNC